MFTLRPAQEEDAKAIRELIHAVQINPMGLDWRRFVLAVTPEGEMAGCGQIKSHGDGSFELASIAVVPAWRGQGLARLLIEYLIDSHPGTLYLTCRSGLRPFYEKFGFQVADPNEMTPYFRRLSRLARVFLAMNRRQEGMLVMKRSIPQPSTASAF